MRVTRELAFPVLRTLPWRAVAAGGGLGLVIAGVQRFAGGEPDAWAALVLLRSAILAHALGLAFLLDDPARHTTAAVPVRRPVRTALRLGYAVALTALWWTALLLLVPSEVRPPVGDITLEAATACALALAIGALAPRLTDEPRPGPRWQRPCCSQPWWHPCCCPTGGPCSCPYRTTAGAQRTSAGHGCWWGQRRH